MVVWDGMYEKTKLAIINLARDPLLLSLGYASAGSTTERRNPVRGDGYDRRRSTREKPKKGSMFYLSPPSHLRPHRVFG